MKKILLFVFWLEVKAHVGPQFCQTPREIVEKKADLYYFVADQKGRLTQISKGEKSESFFFPWSVDFLAEVLPGANF